MIQKSKRYRRLLKVQSLIEAHHTAELEHMKGQLFSCQEETRMLFSLMEKDSAFNFWNAPFLAKRLHHTAKSEEKLQGRIVQQKQVVREASSRSKKLGDKCKKVQSIEKRKQFNDMIEEYITNKTRGISV
ncbi:conserved protein of unknown function [Bartonella clarridgeiae 73]|uniref:Flagellar FliJ protein n=1 Tax=Bartonella clarridgeiae (strain CCUG 45776 / CIP 104772 / 73) TaxID=696125 RepID=E6YGY9_BARC7|nr:hypothetical protein [Bartonella clarridgeiae]WCR55288.1 MAG: Heavy metal RND efflux outer membrane protein CzcC family [Bartonella clarridgeiae]CBI76127.1 conserved protein of unknown function [Bartonella clarridgeiae 73]